ncbi:c-type cytochrome [Undibacterium arcticum]
MALFTGGVLALDIQLPPETATYRPSQLPGYQLVQRNCMTCHSAQYVQSQPPASPRGYWEATVKKMKKPFGAQFPDDEVPAMVDYLAKTYGAERTAVAPVAQKVSTGATAAPAAPVVGPTDAQALITANNCMACHAIDKKVVGPAFKEVAAKYAGKPDALVQVARNIRAGGAGKWGPAPMPPFDQLREADAQTLARYVLSQ